MNKVYLCIDLKSFYASVECVERNLDPTTTNLVVADPERTEKTICLAVSTALREKGVKNRCRVFEIPENIDFIIAPPQMKKYINYSANIYGFYLNYFDKKDIHVYSIDEVFIDVTSYLNLYKMSSLELGKFLINKLYDKFKIKAACGIGTNLFLAKVALDILAKKSESFIYYLDEKKFKEILWDHQPLSDFWRIGNRLQTKLNNIGIMTLKDVIKTDPEVLYSILGVDAELLIDHANGIEPVTIEDIKNYKPKTQSISNGQVLMKDYSVKDAEVILREMVYDLFIKLIKEHYFTTNISISIRNAKDASRNADKFSVSFNSPINSFNIAIKKIISKYYQTVFAENKIRKITVSLNNLQKENSTQLSFFNSNSKSRKDESLLSTVSKIQDRFGKNSILLGMDLLESATSIERHTQIGGHKSGETS